MKRITRTFRLPADLVDRFDRAAAQAGVDKTLVVESAIVEFCERIEAGEKPYFRKETRRMKDVRKYRHGGRTEYYSKSLFDIAEVVPADHRDEFIENGKVIFDRINPVYGIREFFVTIYDNGKITGKIVTGNEVVKEFFRK